MKSGIRALGVAESFRERRSTLAGAVVRADRTVDDLVFGTCTVGGTDATAAVVDLVDRLDRPDVRYVLVAGIAPAWFNVVDLHEIHDAVDRPVVAVSFEESGGLAGAIREAFDGRDRRRRLATYHAQPDRRPLDLGEERIFVRAVGLDEARTDEVAAAFTPEGGRPEPLRVARAAARAADSARRRWNGGDDGADDAA